MGNRKPAPDAVEVLGELLTACGVQPLDAFLARLDRNGEKPADVLVIPVGPGWEARALEAYRKAPDPVPVPAEVAALLEETRRASREIRPFYASHKLTRGAQLLDLVDRLAAVLDGMARAERRVHALLTVAAGGPPRVDPSTGAALDLESRLVWIGDALAAAREERDTANARAEEARRGLEELLAKVEADGAQARAERAAIRAAVERLRARLSVAEARPSVETCKAERASGNGGCGACALCCKEATERAETAEAGLAAVRRVVEEHDAADPIPWLLPALADEVRERFTAADRKASEAEASERAEHARAHRAEMAQDQLAAALGQAQQFVELVWLRGDETERAGAARAGVLVEQARATHRRAVEMRPRDRLAFEEGIEACARSGKAAADVIAPGSETFGETLASARRALNNNWIDEHGDHRWADRLRWQAFDAAAIEAARRLVADGICPELAEVPALKTS